MLTLIRLSAVLAFVTCCCLRAQVNIDHEPTSQVWWSDQGEPTGTFQILADFLNEHQDGEHILIATGTDASTFSAIAATRELGSDEHAVIVGQECFDEMLLEMERHNSPVIACIPQRELVRSPPHGTCAVTSA
jgi:hypothetical protein